MKTYDFLVIGSGIAGLVYAIETAKLGKVAIVTKQNLDDCSTDYAQGGIAAVISKNDDFEKHVEDTYLAGAELGKKEVIRKIVESGPEMIKYLMDCGTEFTVNDNGNFDNDIENLSLTREGGHSHNRIAYAADSTGHQILKALIDSCKRNSNIDIFEDHIAVDLITQHHVSQAKGFIPKITCWGAYVLDVKDNVIKTFRAKKTMLATGGASQVYLNNTNPEVSTGDGIAMASLAGARLVNMEFIQFHPTYFYNVTGKGFLISEALRGEGAVLRLQNGEEFMQNYHKLASLAPRDVVARAIDFEMMKRGEKFVYLDATGVDKMKLKSHFPYIDNKCQKNGFDFTKDYIPVVPAAHYFCGGILATIDGVTDIDNLFAAGECAGTGFHGANRLASNSLLEGVVVAYRASKDHANQNDVSFPEIPDWEDIGEFNENEWVVIHNNKEIIKKIMQGYVGIARSRRLLKYANNRIYNIYTEINNFYQHNSIHKEVIETRNMAIVALKIIQSALMRKESRGLHYLVDNPKKDDLRYKKDTII